MKQQRIAAGLMSLCLLISLLAMPAFAADDLESDAVTDSAEEIVIEPVELRTSELGVALIKELEGFSATAHWDYSQYSIGYGTGCEENAYPDGITEEEADYLLRKTLAGYETELNALETQLGLTFSQQQYDALMSLTYNVGSTWMQMECKLIRCLRRGIDNCSDEEIMNAFGPWCHVNNSSTTILLTLASRRIVETQVFLYGAYTTTASAFYYVIFNPEDGTLSGSQESILYFAYGSSLDTLSLFYTPEIDQTAEKENAVFMGWRTSAKQLLTERSGITQNMTVYAMWDEDVTTGELPAASQLDGFANGFVSQRVVPQTTITASGGTAAGTSQNSQSSQTGGGTQTEQSGSTGTGTQTGTSETTGAQMSSVSFSDVSSTDWYASAVEYVVSKGIFNGTSATTFSPEDVMTRAQFVQVLANYTGVDLSAYGTPNFTDVSASDWYCKAVSWAAQCGIVTGYTDGSFGAEDPINREQMCTILLRYVQVMGGQLPALSTAVAYTDQSRISTYALEAVIACQRAGLISGRTSGAFAPKDGAKRCEVAKVMMAFSELFEAEAAANSMAS